MSYKSNFKKDYQAGKTLEDYLFRKIGNHQKTSFPHQHLGDLYSPKYGTYLEVKNDIGGVQKKRMMFELCDIDETCEEVSLTGIFKHIAFKKPTIFVHKYFSKYYCYTPLFVLKKLELSTEEKFYEPRRPWNNGWGKTYGISLYDRYIEEFFSERAICDETNISLKIEELEKILSQCHLKEYSEGEIIFFAQRFLIRYIGKKYWNYSWKVKGC